MNDPIINIIPQPEENVNVTVTDTTTSEPEITSLPFAPHDIPAGGDEGQILYKTGDGDYALGWKNESSAIANSWGGIGGTLANQTDLVNALNLKVNTVGGKQLSTEDYSTAEKSKLAGIANGATANSSDATLLNRANHTGTQGAATITEDSTHRFTTDAEKSTWNGKQAGDQDLTDIAAISPTNDDVIQRKAGAWTNRSPAQLKTDLALTKSDVALSNVDNTSDVNKPVSTAQAAADALKENLSNKAVNFNTINDTLYPSIKAVDDRISAAVGAAIILQADWNANTNTPDISGTTTTGKAWRVSVAGSFNLGGITSWNVGDLAVKSATGWVKFSSADVSAVWGNISGTLSNQSDLQSALNAKVTANSAITGATKAKITFDSKGLVTAGADLVAGDIPNIAESQVTGLTADLAARALKGANTDITSLYLNNTGLKVKDTDASHGLTLKPNSNLTADRTLNIVTGDADRSLTLTADATISNTNTGDQTIALTGDVTGSGQGSFAATIGADKVDNTKLANMPANSFKGNNTAGVADPLDLTVAQAKALLAITEADVASLTTDLANKVDKNGAITPGTNTKITYDGKGLVTNGVAATTTDINDSVDRRYVTDAQKTVIQNTSGTNTGDQVVSDATLATSDITTNNVTSSKHGFAPKSPAQANQFLNGAATPAFAQVKDSDLALTDITTNNVSVAGHGFFPKLPGGTVNFWREDGVWAPPASVAASQNPDLRIQSSNFTIPDNNSYMIARKYDVVLTKIIAGNGSIMSVI